MVSPCRRAASGRQNMRGVQRHRRRQCDVGLPRLCLAAQEDLDVAAPHLLVALLHRPPRHPRVAQLNKLERGGGSESVGLGRL